MPSTVALAIVSTLVAALGCTGSHDGPRAGGGSAGGGAGGAAGAAGHQAGEAGGNGGGGLGGSAGGTFAQGGAGGDAAACDGSCPKVRGWGEARLLEGYEEGDAYAPRVAWMPNGDALAIWGQASASGNEIWSSRYTPGVGWTAAKRIDNTYARGKTSLDLVVDALGNAVAIWSQGQTLQWGLWAIRYTPEGGWGDEERIDTIDSLNFKKPSAAGDPDGNVIVVWSDENESRSSDMWSNRYTPADGWGVPAPIETRDDSSAFAPAVAMDANGNAVAVWQQVFGTRHDVFANRYTRTGGWGVAQPIEDDLTSSDFGPRVALDHAGNAVAVWQRHQNYFFGDDRDIWWNHYTVGMGWGTAERIDDNERRRSGNPGVAIDPNGWALACWNQLNDDQFSIWCSWHSAAGWGAPDLIEDDTGGNAYFPQPAFDLEGNALVVWERYDDEIFDIWSNRYTRSGGWETARAIENDDRGSATRPQLRLHPEGNAIVVWGQTDGTRHNAWWNRFE